MIDKITFDHFFIETKENITPELYKLLNPNTMLFWRCHNVYFATNSAPDAIIVTMAIGKGTEFISELSKVCKDNSIQYVRFYTSTNNKTVKIIAKYAKAIELQMIKGYYSDGSDAIEYEINVLNNPRFD